MTAFLIEWTIKSTALALVVALLLRLFRVRSPHLQKDIWTVVLVAVLVMPMLMRTHGLVLQAPSFVIAARASGAAGVRMGHSATGSLEALYGVSVLLLLARLGFGLVRMILIWARADVVRDDWTEGLDVRVTDELQNPATFGSTILLPRGCTHWSHDMRAAVLAHERSHVLSRDCYRLWLAHLYRCLCWPNPLAWWLVHRLATLAEDTSDSAAVRATGDGPAYAQILLEFAESTANTRHAAAARVTTAMIRSNLPARIERVIQADAPPPVPHPHRSVLAAVSVVPAVVLLATLQFQPGGLGVPASTNMVLLRRLSWTLPAGDRAGFEKLYPQKASRAGATGFVYVGVTIDPVGHATDVRVIKEHPRSFGFGAAAVRAVHLLRFRNPTGRTVRLTVPIKFALSMRHADAATQGVRGVRE